MGGEGGWAQKWGCNDDNPTKWHRRHGQSNNQLFDGNNGGKMGQWPIASTATATKSGRSNDDNKYGSRGRGGDSRRQTSNKSAISDLTTYWARWRQLYEPVNNNERQRGRWWWWWWWRGMMDEEEEEEGWDVMR